MKKSLAALIALTLLCVIATNAVAVLNSAGKYSIYVAGFHDAKMNTCDYVKTDCTDGALEILNPGGGRYDLYLVATDVNGIAGIRYGICCEVAIGTTPYFYGWTSCSLLEIPTAGWPGCGEGNAQTWATEQIGPHVTLGIIDMYVYAGTNAKVGMCPDPRVGFAEMCDGSEPYPLCNKRFSDQYTAFGYIGINRYGFNPCGVLCPVNEVTWGGLKSLYK